VSTPAGLATLEASCGAPDDAWNWKLCPPDPGARPVGHQARYDPAMWEMTGALTLSCPVSTESHGDCSQQQALRRLHLQSVK